ncbi:MAG TPA: hypothetical protein VNA14_05835 [Mycobacteriales bacterium]|nr:hypothetical protein [Mycobacteriales bacterium]
MKQPTGRLEYAAGRAVTSALLCVAAGFGVFAYVENSAPGRLLLTVAAVGCAVEGLRCALVRPVVAADADGLWLVPGVRPIAVAWSEVERIGGRVERRRGAVIRSLEVDVGETVHVVPAYRLGAPVSAVVSALEVTRPD